MHTEEMCTIYTCTADRLIFLIVYLVRHTTSCALLPNNYSDLLSDEVLVDLDTLVSGKKSEW